uniref:IPKA inhibitor n=1 Tax=Aquila chrysaetos chrysaetos TaxID=223781 RepID=A0A663EP47_AQUCH
MTEVEPVLDFASSGRTGRRNALPDILGSPAGVSPSDLPLKLAEMSLNAGREKQQQTGPARSCGGLGMCTKWSRAFPGSGHAPQNLRSC